MFSKCLLAWGTWDSWSPWSDVLLSLRIFIEINYISLLFSTLGSFVRRTQVELPSPVEPRSVRGLKEIMDSMLPVQKLAVSKPPINSCWKKNTLGDYKECKKAGLSWVLLELLSTYWVETRRKSWFRTLQFSWGNRWAQPDETGKWPRINSYKPWRCPL